MAVLAYLHIAGGGISVLATLGTTSAIWILSHCVKTASRPSLINTLAIAGVAYWTLAQILLSIGVIEFGRVNGDDVLIVSVSFCSVLICYLTLKTKPII